MTPAQPTSSALRFLLPSVRDIIFIFLFWSVLAGPLSNRPLADADIGWHIRTGEQILATHSLPRTDPYSSTMRAQPWFAWEWLYDALLGLLHRSCGLNGVTWICALLTATIFAGLLSQLLQRGTGLLLAVLLMLLSESASFSALVRHGRALGRLELAPRRKPAALDSLVLSRVNAALGQPAWRMAFRHGPAHHLYLRRICRIRRRTKERSLRRNSRFASRSGHVRRLDNLYGRDPRQSFRLAPARPHLPLSD